jgi:hypothetical protein
MPVLRQFFVCLLVLLCTIGASAQQVYIRNQPFEGRVVKDSGGLWVELRPLELILDFESKPEAGGARINGRLVRTIKQGEVTLISLAQAAAALGAVVREDPAFGTVDVHLAMKPTSGTAGLEVGPTTGLSTPTSTVPGDRIETAGFKFILPEGMQVSRDPRLIKAFLSGGGPPIPGDFKFDAMVFHKGDQHFKKGAAVLTWANRALAQKSGEQAQLSLQMDLTTVLMDDLGVEMVGTPEVVQTEGQRFVLGAGIDRAPPYHGVLLLLRIDPKRKRFYQVITGGIPQNDEQPTTDFMKFLSTVTTK